MQISSILLCLACAYDIMLISPRGYLSFPLSLTLSHTIMTLENKITPVELTVTVKHIWLVKHLHHHGSIYCLRSLPSRSEAIVEMACFVSTDEWVNECFVLISSSYSSLCLRSAFKNDIRGAHCAWHQLKHWQSVLIVLLYSPEPLTGHISGICPRAQQRPVSQQQCILVYWPLCSAAQRPLARAEKQVPTRWSKEKRKRISGNKVSWQDGDDSALSSNAATTNVKLKTAVVWFCSAGMLQLTTEQFSVILCM